MANDITILSCPQCGFPRIRDCGNGLYQCDDCGTHFDKSENIVLTNEEWFCQLPTEEKATFLINATMFYDCGETLPFIGALRKASESDFKPYKWLHKDVVAWLKEIHHDGNA